MNNKIKCICGSEFRSKDRIRHEKTKKHIDFINSQNDTNKPIEEDNDNIYESESVNLSSQNEIMNETYNNEEDDNLLNELDNINYKNDGELQDLEKEENNKVKKELQTKNLKLKQLQIEEKITKQNKLNEIEEPTELIGDNLILVKKIEQYKILFPKELKNFRINKKKLSDSEYLNKAINEIELLINLGSVDSFLIDSILESIKVIEGITNNFLPKYNILGLSLMLKSNPQFHHLAKQLMVKYGVYGSMPPEYQLLFIVISSSWICISKNQNKDKINNILDEPLNLPMNINMNDPNVVSYQIDNKK